MDLEKQASVLVVAYKTGATPALLDTIRNRTEFGPCRFSLVIPTPVDGLSPGRRQAKWWTTEGQVLLMLALPLIADAAGEPVDGWASTNPSPVDLIQQTVRTKLYDEIIISMLPQPFLHRLHCDLPSSIANLGLPVTTVLDRSPALSSGLSCSPDNRRGRVLAGLLDLFCRRSAVARSAQRRTAPHGRLSH